MSLPPNRNLQRLFFNSIRFLAAKLQGELMMRMNKPDDELNNVICLSVVEKFRRLARFCLFVCVCVCVCDNRAHSNNLPFDGLFSNETVCDH